MLINKIAFGNKTEAFIEDNLKPGLNIITSDDNNRGKTIVVQSCFYAMGNEPVFPANFNYKDYHHFVELTLDDGSILKCCRNKNSFITKYKEEMNILDSISELKRYFKKIGINIPEIYKSGSNKIVDPVLFFQLFFVGQDKKDTSNINHAGFYKKEDYYNMLYSMANLNSGISLEDVEKYKEELKKLEQDKKDLLKQNKILKSKSTINNFVLETNGIEKFEEDYKKLTILKDDLSDLINQRNRYMTKIFKYEQTNKELNSLNKKIETGKLVCMDCGSKNIEYESADKSFSFDVSSTMMRSNILESIKEKILSFKEEVEKINIEIANKQKLVKEILKNDEVSIDKLIMYKPELVPTFHADEKISEIKSQIKEIKDRLEQSDKIDNATKVKQKELIEKIEDKMNEFFQCLDTKNTNRLTLFTRRDDVYSGCEGTEFYLSKLYAIQNVLNHNYPIVMDCFRGNELSTTKEDAAIREFLKMQNQIIFTATLKKEEINKYKCCNNINNISYNHHEERKILQPSYVKDFLELLTDLNISNL